MDRCNGPNTTVSYSADFANLRSCCKQLLDKMTHKVSLFIPIILSRLLCEAGVLFVRASQKCGESTIPVHHAGFNQVKSVFIFKGNASIPKIMIVVLTFFRQIRLLNWLLEATAS
jgi:hypothetical protein